MNLQEYQDAALETAVYPGFGEWNGITYCALGLNGEAGEVADKIKKIQRDKQCVISAADREALKKEIGDTLWYCAVLAFELGLTLESVAVGNVEKLRSRKKRGVISGSGDDR